MPLVESRLLVNSLPPLDPQKPPENDVAINRAVRWSLAALLLIVFGTIFLLFKTAPGRLSVQSGDTAVPGTSASLALAVPEVRFSDVTAEAGIKFVHSNGAYGEKLLPEMMGGGCAFLDFDADGNQDILFVNSGAWPWHNPDNQPRGAITLYRNDGSGRFSDVTPNSGLEANFYGMGVAVGDYDNDGFPDLFITGVGGNHLFHNDGHGKFKEVTVQAGVTSSPMDWSTSAAWIDYDNDGDLDLFVCNYVRWSRDIDREVDYKLAGIGRAYGPPLNFPGSYPFLYRNEGNGRFSDVSAKAGVQVKNKATGLPMAKALGVAPVDLDGDGWIDLVVANDTVQNFVFHNERNGTFKEIGELTGTAFDNYGKARGAMGIDSARLEQDNSLAISIGNFANEMTALYISQGEPLTFSDEAIRQGIGPASRPNLTFGVFFFDYDLDGWLDLLTVNGHIEEQIEKVQPAQKFRQPAQLFWNARGGGARSDFLPVPPSRSGQDLAKPIVGRGSAFADIDGDGDLDVLLTQINGPPVLLRNEQKLGHHWLRIKLVGTRSNRDAIGAWIKVRAGQQVIWRQVMPTRGYLSQSELPVTIGLGKANRVDEVTVTWPGGKTQRVDSIQIDRVTTIIESR